MRVVDCRQGSEAWEVHRMVRPTASNFGRIITPKRGDLSTRHREYACELVAKQIGLFHEPQPTYWMEWGEEHEDAAIESYCHRNSMNAERVGFVLPDEHELYGGSPDALLAERTGGLEVKCPKPETLIRYHWDGVLPDEHRPQVQGLMLITGCEWWDFFAWHPDLQPFQIRVDADPDYQESMKEALSTFCNAFEDLKAKVSETGVHIVRWGE